VAFRFVAAAADPDHDTLYTCRKRFLKDLDVLMVHALLIARTKGVLKLGNSARDGRTLKANASKHRALSSGHIKKLDAQLPGDVKQLIAVAEAADNATRPDGLNLPEEIARREARLTAIAAATISIEQHAKDRFDPEQADDHATLDTLAAKSKERGTPPRSQVPAPPIAGAQEKDQIHLTDEASRIMNVSGGGFDQCDNGQIAVDMNSLLILTTDTVLACHDTQAGGTRPQAAQGLAGRTGAAGQPGRRQGVLLRGQRQARGVSMP